ncbi:hypothetical protein [Parvibaculum sp. MBR-TMA-1.3b-4.2]
MAEALPTDHISGPEEAVNRRLHRRIATRLEGRIVFAGVDSECLIHEMSASGAIVEVTPLPALGARMALDVPGVGFARGFTARHTADGHAVVALDMPPEKRDRVVDRLILAAFNNPPLT